MRFFLALFIQCFLTIFIHSFAIPDVSDDTLELGAIDEPSSEQISDLEYDPNQEIVADASDDPNPGFVADASDDPCPPQSANRKRETALCKPRRGPEGTLNDEKATGNNIPTDNEAPPWILPNLSPAKLGEHGVKICSDHLASGPRKAICDSGKMEDIIPDEEGAILFGCNLYNPLLGCFKPKWIWCCVDFSNHYFENPSIASSIPHSDYLRYLASSFFPFFPTGNENKHPRDTNPHSATSFHLNLHPIIPLHFPPPTPTISFLRRFFASSVKSPAMSAAARTKAQGIIDDNAVAVFSKSYCPYCRATKELLTEKGAKFYVIELDQVDDGAAIQDALQEITSQRTVPNVFIKQQHIGGNSDLQARGDLAELLKDAGAV